MTKYILIANDRTLEGSPRRMWIHSSKEECMKNMEFLSANSDWTLPIFYPIEDVLIDGEYLK